MKLTRLHILPHAALIALAGLVLAALPARAVIVASDTFSITDSRQAGSTLSGSTTETGNLVWNGNAQWKLAEGGYVTATSANNAGFAVPFSFASYSQTGSIATISFDVTFPRNNDSTWYAFGFGTNASGALNSTSGMIWVQVNSRLGGWLVKTGGTNAATGTLTETLGSYNRNNTYTWSLSYSESTRTIVDVSVNGTSIVSNYVVPESVTLNAASAISFFGQYPAGNSTEKIDNFKLEITSSIPEPGTWALLAGAMFLVGAIAWKKSR
ncbi:PEP-CTERM sorting domain-containing protein [Geminisphaera colitermitum]|uniref:PEP-CTERM sorting domain-containing protein n=1 Tax=Geminisphaera colitermitum TaxID=1148786 RepID=UPI000158C893|nr:PEP-CTERM sorting domain-containing protein [Geminisphaera colitermitum]